MLIKLEARLLCLLNFKVVELRVELIAWLAFLKSLVSFIFELINKQVLKSVPGEAALLPYSHREPS